MKSCAYIEHQYAYSIHTIFSVMILIFTRKVKYSINTRCLAMATNSEDTLTYRPQGILPIVGRGRGYPVPQNSCRPTYLPPCFCYCEGSRAGVLDFAGKRASTPPSASTPLVAFWERGRGPTTPSGNACHEVLHIHKVRS